MMKSYRILAWKELWAEKVTSALLLTAIILSTMMTTVIGQSIGILSAMYQNQAARLNGNRYATLHQLTSEQADELMLDPRLSSAGKIASIGRAQIPGSKISILLREYLGNALLAYPDDSRLESGQLPQNPGELALSRDVLELLGWTGQPGDPITLDCSISRLQDSEIPYEYSHEFILTGILKSNYIGYLTGSALGITGPGTAQSLLPEKYQLYSVDLRTVPKASFQSTIDDLVQKYSIPEYCIQYNAILLDALGISYRGFQEAAGRNGVSYLFFAGILTGALVLAAAGLVIYNILKISVSRRIREYGVLRAIGAGRGMLYTLVTLQVGALCAAGIPVGAGLGLVLSKAAATAAAGFFNPDLFLADSQGEVARLIAENAAGRILPLLVSAGITCFFAFLSALPAARYASNVSPTLAISGKPAKIKRRSRSGFHRGSFEAFYARMNMKRNPGRTAITCLSLIMSITVFVTLQSFTGLLDSSRSLTNHRGDYSLTGQRAGFTAKDLEQLKNTPGIRSVSTLKYQLYESNRTGAFEDINLSFAPQPGETVQIIGLDDSWLEARAKTADVDDLAALLAGNSCLIKNPIPFQLEGSAVAFTSFSTGEELTVNGNTLNIAGILDSPVTLDQECFTNGVQIIVADFMFDRITGQDRYTELYPSLSSENGRETVQEAIRAICDRTGANWFSYEDTDRQLEESGRQIRLLAWSLILFIGLIGILNIINTVITNVHTRMTEIGIQRAIGMDAGSLFRTFLWEGAYYALTASAVGSVSGYLCSMIVEAAVTDSIHFTMAPIVPIIQAAALSIAACLTATCIPLLGISRQNIAETISAVD